MDPAPPSFDDYVRARGRGLWRTAWLLTGDHHRAEDLVQATLVKCWPRWETIAKDGAVDGYVRRSMATTYTDWWRRRWNGELPTGDVPDRPTPDHAPEIRHDVLTALATLPRRQRAVIVLRFYEDLTEAQTAEALGITVGTVKSQTARALCSLRESGLLKEER